MFKYFDNTFFKFLFAFLGILLASFTILVLTRYFEDKKQTEPGLYVEAEIEGDKN